MLKFLAEEIMLTDGNCVCCVSFNYGNVLSEIISQPECSTIKNNKYKEKQYIA